MKNMAAIALMSMTLIGAGVAQAQTVDIGPDGPRLDLRSQRQRQIDREDRMREREYDRRSAYRDRDLVTGSTGCRDITVRERDEYGNVEVRRRRDCR